MKSPKLTLKANSTTFVTHPCSTNERTDLHVLSGLVLDVLDRQVGPRVADKVRVLRQ